MGSAAGRRDVAAIRDAVDTGGAKAAGAVDTSLFIVS